MTVVILVAGRGTRFKDDKPKCLVDINGVSLLEWTISLIRAIDSVVPIKIITGHNEHLIEEYVRSINYEGLEIIHNDDYENDQNILSAQKGMESCESDVLVIEGDCIYNKDTMGEIINSIGTNKNIIFTKGIADINKKNAIIKSNKFGFLTGYLIGSRDDIIDIGEWSNMTGAVLFAKDDMSHVLGWLERNGNNPKESYYFAPLIDFKQDLQVIVERLGLESNFLSFNTQMEYLVSMEDMGIETQVRLVDVKSLKHVEGYSEKRVLWLKEKIIKEGTWTKPICIDSQNNIVMDGQHRMEVAKDLGIKRIPAVLFDHNEVEFWSLRENHNVTLENIIDKSLSGNIYPYKTVKYSFPIDMPKCSINLEEL